jgi:hypothetical protein
VVNAISIVSLIHQRNQINDFHWIFYIEVSFIGVNLIALGFNSVLLGMHVYLLVHKKRTIDFILEKRKISKIHPFEEPNHSESAEKAEPSPKDESGFL